jgi:hypothetical protein
MTARSRAVDPELTYNRPYGDLEAIDGAGTALIERLLGVSGEPSDFDPGWWAFKSAVEYSSIPMHVTSTVSVIGIT